MTPPSQPKIKLLVVDDSSFVRKSLIRMFDRHERISVVDVASDGEMAIERIKSVKPDVVTLDVRMPVMDGLTALARIMKECPVPVVMLSSLTDKGGESTLKALELGAVDFVDKSTAGGAMDIGGLASELTAKILTAAGVNLGKIQGRAEPEMSVHREYLLSDGRQTEVVVIGTSTGGPPALQTVMESFKSDFHCPILVVQHMPVGFTASLAERLNRTSQLTVKEGEDGEVLLSGHVYIAPAGRHMKVIKSGNRLQIILDIKPAGQLHCPSVDVLFESVAAACGDKSLAVVLTGMGRDGANGAKAVKNNGGRVIVESEASAIVYGMPKAVAEAVDIDASVPLGSVAGTIISMVGG